ncbi:D-alanyl-D-alanine carboxypeptidase/D-alanyl-D-alanine-endopeptidase [Thalassococcus sp. CAU 1522]|uniref:D-alanyl-D-alanine carboxypeptidase/D-alanyl-D-alanine-endopeptidase n=1 Tax=Thalassococcus arenae TaxID=2851652 RepID=A0ABS6N423_9RHOB|nr:D-alanyl-D-alanine carboxypeptidase/D-alanyl-D-alanine-endopeptidase [Thalassococcus arenae]MBV2358778.1 D-alanyl-D-alanine carboxypeptidase/D-alanyl-D-alanine-endopeptidase [Thalassococcus arenae]
MTMLLSRRHVLTALAAFGAAPALAEAPATSLRPVGRASDFVKRVQPSADDLIARSGLSGSVGFAVADTADGTILERGNDAAGMPPASVAKALTAAYALDVLGPGHHFVTRVLGTGPVEDGVLQGDLILAGGGDPVLDTDALNGLVGQLRDAGITGISGDLRVWGGALPFAGVIDSDQPDHVGYNPALSGLNLNFNRVHFEWRRNGQDYSVTMDARSETLRPAVRMARMRLESRKAPVYTYRDADERDNWTVARGALGNGGARWLPVRKPELYAGEVFQALAAAAGLRVPAPRIDRTPSEGVELARHESPPLRVILRDMLRYSTNLTAEVVGMTASRARLGFAVDLRGSATAMNLWAVRELGLTRCALVDHSGLGDASRIGAADMVRALAALRQRQGLKPLLKTIALRDEKGRPVEGHPITVRAKTGTLNFVSGLAGFADLPDGREVVFAIFAADLEQRSRIAREDAERPPGAAAWNRRAKTLQQALIERWGVVHST